MMQNMVRYRRESSIYGEQGYLNKSEVGSRKSEVQFCNGDFN